MNITREDTSDLTATIKIEIKHDDYKDAVQKILKDYQKKANVPGFRPGKVPFGMINKMYGRNVVIDEVNKSLSESISKYITENKLNILGNPLPNIEKSKNIDWDNFKDFEFYFDLGFAPEFDIDLENNIEIDYYNILPDQKMVDENIKGLQKRYGTTINPETAEENDILKGEIIELDENGEIKENGVKNYTSIMPAYIKLKTVKSKFIGAKKGKEIKFNPLNAIKNNTEVSSMLGIKNSEDKAMNSDYKFTVETIERILPAEINKDLFKKVFPNDNIETEEEFTELVKKDLSKSFVYDSDRKFLNDVQTNLLKTTNLSLPDEFMKRWIFENNKDKFSKEDIEKDYTANAEGVKWQLIENKIVEKYKIDVSDKDVKDYVINYFKQQFPSNPNDSEEDINKRLGTIADSVLKNKEEAEKIKTNLFSEKLTNLFKSKIKIKNKDIEFEKFVKLVSKKEK